RLLITPFYSTNTRTTESYSLSLHDALPISPRRGRCRRHRCGGRWADGRAASPCSSTPSLSRLSALVVGEAPDKLAASAALILHRSEEHTSELQSRGHLVCRLLLEKKKYAAS